MLYNEHLPDFVKSYLEYLKDTSIKIFFLIIRKVNKIVQTYGKSVPEDLGFTHVKNSRVYFQRVATRYV